MTVPEVSTVPMSKPTRKNQVTFSEPQFETINIPTQRELQELQENQGETIQPKEQAGNSAASHLEI